MFSFKDISMTRLFPLFFVSILCMARECRAEETVQVPRGADHWLVLPGRTATVGVDRDLKLNVYQGIDAAPAWQSVGSSPPRATIAVAGRQEPVNVRLADAPEPVVGPHDDGTHQGHRILLRGYPDVDVELELVLALNADGELMVEIEQVGGKDTVQRIEGLYDWRVMPAPDAYLLVPRGSGYLLRADSPHEVKVNGFIGSNHSLPLFGAVHADKSLYQIVDTWWDAAVSARHTPHEQTVMALRWEASLGELNYRRRVFIRFAENLDHVGMAKAYRQWLIDRHEFKTLKERAAALPKLKKYLEGVEYRWTHWKEGQTESILRDIRNFQAAGLPVAFFYPKWPSQGIGKSTSFDAGWQGYVHPNPVPGGWPAAKALLDTVRAEGCTIKRMIAAHNLYEDAPEYDPAKLSGVGFPKISDRHAEWTINRSLDFMEEHDFELDALYFDGHAAHQGHNEHRGISRRDTYQAQIAQFRETRRRGIVPGAELARAWAIPECDFFFFTDWSSDRLRHGEPIPWVPLVFHDCYGAHFSGGGYYHEGKYDWYEDRHPRLYELMYAAIPSYNWLPGGSAPIQADDWGTDKMDRRLRWLKRWHTYYQAVCYAEMTSHQFLNPQRTLQRVEFANGVVADFDLKEGLFRVTGVDGFTGDWEEPVRVIR